MKTSPSYPFSRAALVAVGLVAAAAVARAEDRVFQGGIFNDPNNWSPQGVPGAFDRAFFTSDHTGIVQTDGGFDVDSIVFDNLSDGYNLTGNGIGRALVINNFGFELGNTVSLAQLTGQEIAGQHFLLVGGNRTVINSSIVDDPLLPLTPFDLYLVGDVTRPGFYTGKTEINGRSALRGQGAFNSTSSILLDAGELHLDNTDQPGPLSSRINDQTRVGLRSAIFTIDGDQNEVIGGLDIAAGRSVFQVRDGATVSAVGPHAATRDPNLRGILRIEPGFDGGSYLRTAPDGRVGDIVPWASIGGQDYYLPARYNDGPDNAAGSADDIGFQTVPWTFFNPATSTINDDVVIDSPVTLTFGQSLQVRSLTIGFFGELHLDGGGSILVESGVISLSTTFSGHPISQTLVGTVQIPSGREAFLHAPWGDYEISARLSGNNGLTMGGGGNIKLSGSNNLGGPVTMNGGQLTLSNPSAVTASNRLRLAEAALNIDYSLSSFPNNIVFDSGTSTPLGFGSAILDVRIPNGADVTFGGVWQGSGARFLSGTNSTFRFTSTQSPDIAQPLGALDLFVNDTINVENNGRLGDANLGQYVTFHMLKGRLSGTGETSGGTGLSDTAVFAPGPNLGNGIGKYKCSDLGMFGGNLQLQANGTNRGLSYDAIDLTDFLFFGGEGSISISGSLNGAVGTKLEFIHAPTVFGIIPTVHNTLGLLQSNTRWVYYFDVDSFDLAVAGPVGDADLSGSVGLGDFTRLAAAFGGAGSWINGDFNNDHTINLADFTLLAANFGQSAGELPRGAAVPEPASILGLSLTVLRVHRRRKA